MKNLRMQQEMTDRGRLEIRVNTRIQARPVSGARVTVSYTGDPQNVIEELITDGDGRTETLDLATPPLEYSLEPNVNQPYSEYTVKVEAEGYELVEVTGSELLSGEQSVQQVDLKLAEGAAFADVTIPDHTLFGEYPAKIPESEIKPTRESGEIVLSRVVIPEYIIVHDGAPTDSTARDYYVRYRDYIKNVACSEIYATWPDAAIRANILAIMSFTLNRVYTEWYRNKGYDFTITSSTAYDHKWIYGRNIFDSISLVVDEIFADYLSRPNVKQPILTQYCDGNRVSCPNWMSQWGSKNLADQGYSTIQILRNYYGDNMYINTAEEISGIPSSWPGYDLTIGSSGNKVLQMQEQLNVIAEVYSSIPTVYENGYFDEETQDAVEAFQRLFGLPVSGHAHAAYDGVPSLGMNVRFPAALQVVPVLLVAHGQQGDDDEDDGPVAAVAVAILDDVGQARKGDEHGHSHDGGGDGAPAKLGVLHKAQVLGVLKPIDEAEDHHNAGGDHAQEQHQAVQHHQPVHVQAHEYRQRGQGGAAGDGGEVAAPGGEHQNG